MNQLSVESCVAGAAFRLEKFRSISGYQCRVCGYAACEVKTIQRHCNKHSSNDSGKPYIGCTVTKIGTRTVRILSEQGSVGSGSASQVAAETAELYSATARGMRETERLRNIVARNALTEELNATETTAGNEKVADDLRQTEESLDDVHSVSHLPENDDDTIEVEEANDFYAKRDTVIQKLAAELEEARRENPLLRKENAKLRQSNGAMSLSDATSTGDGMAVDGTTTTTNSPRRERVLDFETNNNTLAFATSPSSSSSSSSCIPHEHQRPQRESLKRTVAMATNPPPNKKQQRSQNRIVSSEKVRTAPTVKENKVRTPTSATDADEEEECPPGDDSSMDPSTLGAMIGGDDDDCKRATSTEASKARAHSR